jgi:ketosteroid isomerase-like protein
MSLCPRLVRALAASAAPTLFALTGHAAPLPTAPELAAIANDVKAAETAFAKTMADRRIDRFGDYVAADAVFNGSTMQVGHAAVIAAWSAFFKGPQAPFSWAPDAVAVAADGRTAVSTGPVRTPDGKMVSRFTSIWRKDADGRWRVIADQGVDACECPPEKK